MYVLGNKAILGFRGTQDSKDLYDDLEISLGRLVFPRAVEASDWVFALRSLNQHLDLDLSLTGHSLGGGIAREVGRILALDIVTFNSASPPSAPVTNPVRSVNYHIVFDLISAWQSPGAVRIDKGYRPWSAFPMRIPYLWVHHILYGVKPAHKLTNFTKRLPGNVVTAGFENEIIQRWFLGFSTADRLFMLTYLIGAAGSYGISIPVVT